MINPSRRSLIIGIGASLIAAPAIVRASSLMKVKPLPCDGLWKVYTHCLPTKLYAGDMYFMGPDRLYVYGGDNFVPLVVKWSAESDIVSWEPSDASFAS